MTQGTLGAAYRKLASPQQYIDPELIADWEWATVTSVSPLRVRRDGDSSASGTPASLVGADSLAVGDRVMTVIVKGSLIVIGRYGGVTQSTVASSPLASADSYTSEVPGIVGQANTANGWPIDAVQSLLEVHATAGYVHQRLSALEAPYAEWTRRAVWSGSTWEWSHWRGLDFLKRTKATDQTIASASTWYRMAWDTTVENVGSGLTVSGSNIGVTYDDYYEVNAQISWDPIDGTPRRLIQLELGTTPGVADANRLTRNEQTTYDFWVGDLQWKGWIAAGSVLGVSIWSASTNSYPHADFSFFSVKRMTR